MPRIKKTPIRRSTPPSPVKAPSIKAARASVFETFGEGITQVGDALLRRDARKSASRGGSSRPGNKQLVSIARRVIQGSLTKENLAKTQGELIRDNWGTIWAEASKSNPGIFNEKTRDQHYTDYTNNEDIEPILNDARMRWADSKVIRNGGLGNNIVKQPAKKDVTKEGRTTTEKYSYRPILSFKSKSAVEHMLKESTSEFDAIDSSIADKLPQEYYDKKVLEGRKEYVNGLTNRIRNNTLGRKEAVESLNANLEAKNLSRAQYDEALVALDEAKLQNTKDSEYYLEYNQRRTLERIDPISRQVGPRNVQRIEALDTNKFINTSREEINTGRVLMSTTFAALDYKVNTDPNISPVVKSRIVKFKEEIHEAKTEAIYGISTKGPTGLPFFPADVDQNQPPQEAGVIGDTFSNHLFQDMARVTPGWETMTPEDRQGQVRSAFGKVGFRITKSVGKWVDRNYHKFNTPELAAQLSYAIANNDVDQMNQIMQIPGTPSVSDNVITPSNNLVESRENNEGLRQNKLNQFQNWVSDQFGGQ